MVPNAMCKIGGDIQDFHLEMAMLFFHHMLVKLRLLFKKILFLQMGSHSKVASPLLYANIHLEDMCFPPASFRWLEYFELVTEVATEV